VIKGMTRKRAIAFLGAYIDWFLHFSSGKMCIQTLEAFKFIVPIVLKNGKHKKYER